MSESACLHIQARDADPIRVVEIPGTSVRIGRASYCEVRLPEPEVADEECRLRRRGGTWHLVPVGRTGLVKIDDLPVERPRPIPFGVPFRVGDHRLTLQATSDGPGRWGSFHRPIPLELPAVEATPRDEPPRPATEPVAEPEPGPGPAGFEDEQERLARWQARQEQRESWLRSRQEERRWEERWKAAGERLRARSAAAPPRPAPSTVPTAHERVDRIASPPREGVRARKMPRRTVPVTPPSTGDGLPPLAPEPVVPPAPPPRRAPVTSTDWGAIPIPTRANPPREPAPRDEPAAAEAEARIAVPPAVPEPTTAQDESSGSFDATDPIKRDAWVAGAERSVPRERRGTRGTLRSAPATHNPPISSNVACPGGFSEQASPVGPDEPAVSETADKVGPTQEEDSLPTAPTQPAVASRETAEPGPIPGRFEASTGDCLTGWDDRAAFTVDTSRPATEAEAETEAETEAVEEAGEIPARPRPGVGRARRGAARNAASGSHSHSNSKRAESPKSVRTATLLSPPVPIPGPSGAENDESRANSRDWPTAREIFAAHRARQEAQPSPSPAPARALPLPTVSREPASWSLPLWLGWPLAMLSSVGVGGMVLALAVAWSQDDQAAGLVANHLALGQGKAKPLPETLVPPAHPSWWSTTSGNLARWAQERARSPNEPGPAVAEEVHALLEAATSIAPLDAVSRLALARSGTGDGGAGALDRSLGLSRDVVALAWSGRQLLAAGKKAAALKAYREAMEMASRAELSRLAPPEFLDDSPTRRYALPYEDLLGVIVRDLVERTDWRFAEWSEALPRSGVAPLVAARMLRERSGLDADAALDAVLADAEAPLPEGLPVAVHLAARGEALALKSRWSEAEERYRKAIDLMPDDRVRRSWSFNLADLARRLGDEPKRLKALEMARGADSRDEVARRAFEAIREAGARTLTAGAPARDASRPTRSR